MGHVVAAPAVMAQLTDCVGHAVVVGRDRASSPVVTILRGWKLSSRQGRASHRPGRRGAPSAPAVLDHGQIRLLEPSRPAEQMHGENRARSRPDLDQSRVEVHRQRIDVDEHRLQPRQRNDVRRRGERVRGDDHLVPRVEPEREHRKVQPGRARRHGNCMTRLARARQLRFEFRHAHAHREHAALDHLGHHVQLLEPDVRPR